jgi:hypothetical protein
VRDLGLDEKIDNIKVDLKEIWMEGVDWVRVAWDGVL